MLLGESFIAELTDVRLVSPTLGSPPSLHYAASVAMVTVPEEVANSEVSLQENIFIYTSNTLCGAMDCANLQLLSIF